MKCLSCDKILSDFEATRRSAVTGEFLDLCNNCFTESGIFFAIERQDLAESEDVKDEEYEE